MKLGFTKVKSPCHSTITETLNRIDTADLERIIYKERSKENGSKVLNVDGKCLKGSKCQEEKALHMLGAFCHELLSSAGQVMLAEGENEITGMIKLLKTIDIKGKTVTGDAIFTQKNIVKVLLRKGEILYLRSKKIKRI